MKAELKKNSVNQVIKGTNIFEEGDEVTEIGLLVKGRVCVQTEGAKLMLGSGNFLGLCDLLNQTHSVTYTADTNLVVYSFPAANLNATIRALLKANKDYAPLMVSTLSKYIRELSKILEELENIGNTVWQFAKDSYRQYQEIGRKTGAKPSDIRQIDTLEAKEDDIAVDFERVEYYRACAELSSDIQKAYFGANTVIASHHISEEVNLVRSLLQQCREDAAYLRQLAGPLVLDTRSLYVNILQQATMLQHAGEDMTEVMSLFDDVIDKINTLENVLSEKAGVDLEIDHDFMEESYFGLLNGGKGSVDSSVSGDDMLALVEERYVSVDELSGALDQILDYSELESDKAMSLRSAIEAFQAMPDKFATDDDARNLRRSIVKVYYELYEKVFLKDFHSEEDTPLVIDLFLRYGFISERLLSESTLEALLSLDRSNSGIGSCDVYDMKEWLTLILKGEKEPSKSEFDMDYDENLRDMRKTGQITPEQQQTLSRDLMAKFRYEVENMFRTNHRIVFGQVSAFVPFLFQEACTTSLERGFLSKDRLNAAVQRLLHIDFSAFYRESLYAKEGSPFAKEYIQEEVFPDIIILPAYGSKTVMWQELSGRRRNSKGRFLMPIFLESDLDSEMIRLFGRFRWELCRTIQGAAWNNVQIKSLTSEYADFVQFYRKNRELSEDKKEKLKLQIQKCRNNTREVFVVDYENWIKHEAQGGLCLSKPVREIMATYCPFPREMREKVSEQPMFRDAMARFNRERAKRAKEYDLKFKVWEKDELPVPKEVIAAKRFYTEY